MVLNSTARNRITITFTTVTIASLLAFECKARLSLNGAYANTVKEEIFVGNLIS